MKCKYLGSDDFFYLRRPIPLKPVWPDLNFIFSLYSYSQQKTLAQTKPNLPKYFQNCAKYIQHVAKLV